MDLVAVARDRVTSAIDLINALRAGSFPHQSSLQALSKIKGILNAHLIRLDRLDEDSDRSVVIELCENVSLSLHEYLPILGFLYRSRKPHNAFELYGPLLRIAQSLIGPNTKLILSSEWDYSPFTYVPFSDLPDFVWVGLPASESSNALLMPLAGHEFGHSVWAARDISSAFQPLIMKWTIDYLTVEENWKALVKAHPEANAAKDPNERFLDFFVVPLISQAYKWAIDQCEEIFCDLVGLRVFGESYLHAFAYVLAPGSDGRGNCFYPRLEDRVSHLILAAEQFSVPVHTSFKEAFNTTASSGDTEFLVALADEAARGQVTGIIDRVEVVIEESDLSLATPEEVEAGLLAFERLSPFEGAKSLSAIVNAGWRATNGGDFWTDYKGIKNRKEALNELLLKSAQVLEFNSLKSAHDDSAS